MTPKTRKDIKSKHKPIPKRDFNLIYSRYQYERFIEADILPFKLEEVIEAETHPDHYVGSIGPVNYWLVMPLSAEVNPKPWYKTREGKIILLLLFAEVICIVWTLYAFYLWITL